MDACSAWMLLTSTLAVMGFLSSLGPSCARRYTACRYSSVSFCLLVACCRQPMRLRCAVLVSRPASCACVRPSEDVGCGGGSSVGATTGTAGMLLARSGMGTDVDAGAEVEAGATAGLIAGAEGDTARRRRLSTDFCWPSSPSASGAPPPDALSACLFWCCASAMALAQGPVKPLPRGGCGGLACTLATPSLVRGMGHAYV
mmetsp:Transcript_2368/g.5943  ORF Transcript_2368/g.5943 Transcript_2368/m.5943 type:complete len:201 (-) Transcript_2368:952-1554(-)